MKKRKTLLTKREQWFSTGIAIVGTLLFLLIREWIPFRVLIGASVLISLVCLIGLLAILRTFIRRKGQCTPHWLGFAIGFFVSLTLMIVSLFDYEFVEGEGALLLFSLIAGVVVGGIVTVKLFWKSGVGFRIGMFALAAFLATMLTAVYAVHLNFVLDIHAPQQYSVWIEDKKIDTNAKAPDTYEFKGHVNGERVELAVKYSDYVRYEVGDEYTFQKYPGAFGASFYLSR